MLASPSPNCSSSTPEVVCALTPSQQRARGGVGESEARACASVSNCKALSRKHTFHLEHLHAGFRVQGGEV